MSRTKIPSSRTVWPLRLLCTCLWLVLAGTVFCPASTAAETSLQRPLRIAYIEGGFYTDYAQILATLAHGLKELGLIENGDIPLPDTVESTADIWRWLCANAGGRTVQFVPDGYYSANWNEALFAKKRAALIKRLNTGKDIDLVLALGTKAGQAMAQDDHKTPVAILAVTDAVTAGIIASPEDSGRDHVFAMVEPGRYYNEIILFHQIFGFTRMGIAYEESEQGRATIALPQIRQAAKDAGFDLITCADRLFSDVTAVAVANLRQCYEKLAEAKVDAVYLTVNNGMRAGSIDYVLRPLREKRLPTFSQGGVEDVRWGALLSISQVNFSGYGKFAAGAIANILKGELPRAQKQSYEEPMSLAVNLRTAMQIGWNPPLAVLSAVDRVFQGK